MRTAALLCAALLSAPAARAEVKTYEIGKGLAMLAFGETMIGSRDGYHVARLLSVDGHDVWEKDGVELARAEAGVFRHSTGMKTEPALLSADGKILLHLMTVHAPDGRTGVAAALNGRPAGGVHAEIKLLSVSPHGQNVAYAARDDAGWSVHSIQGVGPALPDAPKYLFLSDSGVLYLTRWKDASWLYRDGAPTVSKEFIDMSVSPDLKRVGGVFYTADGQDWVVVDGAPSGPWTKAHAPVFSDDGGHYAFLAAKNADGWPDTVVVDGTARAASPIASRLRVDAAGVPYWQASPSGRAGVAYRDGVALPSSGLLLSEDWIGLSPSGAHYAYWSEDGLIEDGKVAEKAPRPGMGMPIVFDGEKEFHYITDGLQLVCATVDGSMAARTRCAKVARTLDKSRAAKAE